MFIRPLIIAFLLLHLASCLVGLVSMQIYDEGAVRLLQYSGYGGILNSRSPIFYSLLVIPVIGALGIYLRHSWGAKVFLAAMAINCIAALLFGVSVSGPIESMLSYMAVTTAGAILAQEFLHPKATGLHVEGTE